MTSRRLLIVTTVLCALSAVGFTVSFNAGLTALSLAMLMSSSAYQLIGLPKQAFANLRRRSVAGQDQVMILTGAASYGTSAVRAALMGDWWMLASRGPGAFWSAVITMQVFMYGRRDDGGHQEREAMRLLQSVNLEPAVPVDQMSVIAHDGGLALEVISGNVPGRTPGLPLTCVVRYVDPDAWTAWTIWHGPNKIEYDTKQE